MHVFTSPAFVSYFCLYQIKGGEPDVDGLCVCFSVSYAHFNLLLKDSTPKIKNPILKINLLIRNLKWAGSSSF